MEKISKIENFIESLDRDALNDQEQGLLMAGGLLLTGTDETITIGDGSGGGGNNCLCQGNNCKCHGNNCNCY